MKRTLITFGIVACLVGAVPGPARAALNAYLRLTGETQGEIRGSVTQAGREDSIMIIAVDMPYPGRGMFAQTITLTKEVDRSSTPLYTALANSERFTAWNLRFWQPSPSGQEVQFYTISLSNARVKSIHLTMLNNKYPENMQHKEREQVVFEYERITITNELESTSFTGTGNERVASAPLSRPPTIASATRASEARGTHEQLKSGTSTAGISASIAGVLCLGAGLSFLSHRRRRFSSRC